MKSHKIGPRPTLKTFLNPCYSPSIRRVFFCRCWRGKVKQLHNFDWKIWPIIFLSKCVWIWILAPVQVFPIPHIFVTQLVTPHCVTPLVWTPEDYLRICTDISFIKVIDCSKFPHLRKIPHSNWKGTWYSLFLNIDDNADEDDCNNTRIGWYVQINFFFLSQNIHHVSPCPKWRVHPLVEFKGRMRNGQSGSAQPNYRLPCPRVVSPNPRNLNFQCPKKSQRA